MKFKLNYVDKNKMSDKSDYSFMTDHGFNILNQPNTTTEELTKNVTALVLTFCNNALESI